jgi:imidazolonepropionase-like amidohydrolase
MAGFDRRRAGFLVMWLAAAALIPVGQPAAQAPAATTAFVGARVFDGTGAAALEQATIVVTNGRIAAVGTGSVAIPAGAARVDVSGKTIVPGLINAHGHVQFPQDAPAPREALLAQLKLYSDYGVTTVVSLTDDGLETVKVRDEQAAGPIERARLFASGPAVLAKTPDEARQAIDRAAAMKVDVIKTRLNGNANDMTPDTYTALIDQAHKRGLKVAAHMFSLEEAKGLVGAGLDVLAHSVRDQEVDRALIDELRRRNVGYIPTMTRDLSVFAYEEPAPFFTDPFFLRRADAYQREIDVLKDPGRQAKIRNDPAAQALKKALAIGRRNVKLLADAGVMVVMGTDSGALNAPGRWQGYFEHVELEMMVQSGLTPMQALVAATGNAAKVMGLEGLGTLQRGNWADMLVLNANPLQQIANTHQIDSVWIAGRLLGSPK